jgi:hypothetical protein
VVLKTGNRKDVGISTSKVATQFKDVTPSHDLVNLIDEARRSDFDAAAVHHGRRAKAVARTQAWSPDRRYQHACHILAQYGRDFALCTRLRLCEMHCLRLPTIEVALEELAGEHAWGRILEQSRLDYLTGSLFQAERRGGDGIPTHVGDDYAGRSWRALYWDCGCCCASPSGTHPELTRFLSQLLFQKAESITKNR